MKGRKDEAPEPGKWFGIGPVSYVARRLGMVEGYYPIKPFIYPRHWAQQKLYGNRAAPDFDKNFLKHRSRDDIHSSFLTLPLI